MSKLKNVAMVIFMVVCMLAVIGVYSHVSATDANPISSLDDLNSLTSDNPTNDAAATTNASELPSIGTTDVNGVASDSTTNDTGSVGVVQPTTNTLENDEEESDDEKLPQTGITEDITLMFFITVCVVSAVFAYKKVRDYNI